jgi:two-component system, sporulation sensor kinase E
LKSAVLEKILSRLDQIEPEEVQALLSRLVREKGFLQKVFEALQEGVLLLDTAGGISFINHAGCRFFGTSPEEAQGKPLEEVVRGVDWSALMQSNRRT